MTTPFLRSTRRGWMIFMDADAGGGSGSPAAEQPNEIVKADPAVEQAAAEAQGLAAPAKPEGAPPAPNEPKTEKNAVEDLTAELNKANDRVKELERAAREKDADAALSGYQHLPDETKTLLRAEFLNDPDRAKVLISAMPKGTATPPTPAVNPPPSPIHTAPGAQPSKSEPDLGAQITARANEKLSKDKNYPGGFTAAWNEARKEIEKESAAGK